MPKTLQKHVMSHLEGAEENGENSKAKLKNTDSKSQLSDEHRSNIFSIFLCLYMLAGNVLCFSSFIIFRCCQKVYLFPLQCHFQDHQDTATSHEKQTQHGAC